MQVNTFVPTGVNRVVPTVVNDINPEVKYAFERLQSGLSGASNPQFALTNNYNRLEGAEGPIFRGYIRRSDIDPADPTSGFRLYFMYNPETIRRSYVAYLNQQALDPGNAMFGSNNLAAAPGIVDFSFELLFDRHIEVSRDPADPGTKIDYDYFDLVVRGVVPNSTTAGNDIPDNGIMMVNPSNLTVVFGQELAVKGKAYNARVRLEKFNHRMVPTRMRISIAMKVFYMGPVQTIPSFLSLGTQGVSASTVPYDDKITYTTSVEALSFKYIKPIVTPTTSSSGYASPYVGGGGSTTLPSPGVAPAGIPRGPLPLRIVRDVDSYVTSSVEPVTLTGDQVMSILLAQGFPIRGAIEMWATAKAESGFVANIAGINYNQSIDVGVWQINSINFGGLPAEYFTDPWNNAEKAKALWVGRGNTPGAWYAWTTGNAKSYVPEAEAFFASRGVIDGVL